jgi:hypothetical protein
MTKHAAEGDKEDLLLSEVKLMLIKGVARPWLLVAFFKGDPRSKRTPGRMLVRVASVRFARTVLDGIDLT